VTWTEADAAEQDCLLDELVRGYWEHRSRCSACQPCPVPGEWREHRKTCPRCEGSAPLTFGASCERHAEFIAHGATCKRCRPCPVLQRAVAVVLDWRQARDLLSRAEALRREQDQLAAEAGRPAA
jgi:hypothetical protein